MAPPGATSAPLWVRGGLLVLLLALSGFYFLAETNTFFSTHSPTPHREVRRAFLPDTIRGPAHQNPSKAPPQPLAQVALDLSSAEISQSHFLASRGFNNSLGRRDALRCDGGPCVDGSCCGKDNICGYGPDFCGTGCRFNCTATAMCGEFSENAEMPCGMKLCCSASGWCGVSLPRPYRANAAGSSDEGLTMPSLD